MSELLKVDFDTQTVSARELHEKLNIEKRFSAWFETNSQGFIEGDDYAGAYLEVRGNQYGGMQELQDYKMSIDMAKHICLMSRTEKGKQCRQYFIELEKAWNTPEQIFARALKMADAKIQNLQSEVNVKNQIIGELKPKADYVDRILQNKGLVTITQIAKDYGMSGREMNERLHDLGIQYKQSEQWLLYAPYQKCGYTHSDTIDITRSDGRSDVKMNTKWTQKGRLFLYEKLKTAGIYPVIEKD